MTANQQQDSVDEGPRVGLFITCLVDMFRPSIGFATIKLLRGAGCQVEVPESQTCCGQPAYNSGDRQNTKALALAVISAFENYDYIVAPSGSCAAMLRKHYPTLFEPGSQEKTRAEAVAAKTYELVSFLYDVLKVESLNVECNKTITYHDSCSGYRELSIYQQPRKLLASVAGSKIIEMQDSEICCGFGGTFCVKNADISNDMVSKKTANIINSNADLLLAGDLGCLMNMSGKLKRNGSTIEVRHIAEVLAGQLDNVAIGEEE